jgi:hypothetical protein
MVSARGNHGKHKKNGACQTTNNLHFNLKPQFSLVIVADERSITKRIQLKIGCRLKDRNQLHVLNITELDVDRHQQSSG